MLYSNFDIDCNTFKIQISKKHKYMNLIDLYTWARINIQHKMDIYVHTLVSLFLEVGHICTRVAVIIFSKIGHICTPIAVNILVITPDTKKIKKISNNNIRIVLKYIYANTCFLKHTCFTCFEHTCLKRPLLHLLQTPLLHRFQTPL